MSTTSREYKMTLDLNILNHLGFKLYSNISAVLSEAVANAWDADAENIWIDIEPDKITIMDDGHGMSYQDINDKFLTVGYQKRTKGEGITPKFKREVMGRKGIGKLSLFSIAKDIEIHTVRNIDGTKDINAFLMRSDDIEIEIKQKKMDSYYPKPLDPSRVRLVGGTQIFLTNLKKNVSNTEVFLRRQLARRFSIIGEEHKFTVIVNDDPITIEDRDYFSKLQYLWNIKSDINIYLPRCSKLEKHEELPYDFSYEEDGVTENYEISGWIGSVEHANQLQVDKINGISDNKIVIMSRGKLVQEDLLEKYGLGSFFAKYLVGEIHANFLDYDHKEDIATSNRQAIIEDDLRYKNLVKFVHSLLMQIQKSWDNWRNEGATEKARQNAVLDEWYKRLGPGGKKHANKMFGTIQNLHVDKEEERTELYKHGILAFEKLRLRESLEALDMMESIDQFKLVEVFADIDSIEATMYYDIASERLRVIKEFSNIIDKNEPEKEIQKYIFEHLWLLHPSWDRVSDGGRMEEAVHTAFKKVKLSKEEKANRFDIKYRTTAGKHIIIELKKADRKLSVFDLVKQVNKYRDTLINCLKQSGIENEPVESIILIGQPFVEKDSEVIRKTLDSVNARHLLYNQIINESIKSYKDYLDKNAKAGELRKIIEKLDGQTKSNNISESN